MALPLRVTVPSAPYPFAAPSTTTVALTGLSSSFATGSASQQHPRRPSVAAPLRVKSRDGAAAAVAAVVAAGAAAAAVADGDDLCEGLHSYPSRVLMSVLDSCKSLIVVVRT